MVNAVKKNIDEGINNPLRQEKTIEEYTGSSFLNQTNC